MQKINIEWHVLLSCSVAYISGLLGGFDKGIKVLLVLVVLDYITGVMKACVLKKLSSYIGFKGILRKICLFIILAVSVQLEILIGNPETIHNLIAYAFVVNECISILENISEMGIPVPPVLKNILRRMNDQNQNNILYFSRECLKNSGNSGNIENIDKFENGRKKDGANNE